MTMITINDLDVTAEGRDLSEEEQEYFQMIANGNLFGEPLDNNISLDEEIIQDITQEIIKGDIMLMFKDLGQCHTTAYDKTFISRGSVAVNLILTAFELRAILLPMYMIREQEKISIGQMGHLMPT
ncbi:hypothetical protein ACJX0J_031193 [Zea mays]